MSVVTNGKMWQYSSQLICAGGKAVNEIWVSQGGSTTKVYPLTDEGVIFEIVGTALVVSARNGVYGTMGSGGVTKATNSQYVIEGTESATLPGYRTYVTSVETGRGIVALVGRNPPSFGLFSALTAFNATNWDTSKATSLPSFPWATSLTSVNGLATWDLSNVTSLASMFASCSSLTDLNGLAPWDVSSVKNMQSIFSGCTSLTSLTQLSGWRTAALTALYGAFSGCSSLSDISGLSGWDVSGVSDFGNLFYNCTSLGNLKPLSSWDTSSLETCYQTFAVNQEEMTVARSLSGLGGWDMTKVTSCDRMFYNSPATPLGVQSAAPIAGWCLPNMNENGLDYLLWGNGAVSDAEALDPWADTLQADPETGSVACYGVNAFNGTVSYKNHGPWPRWYYLYRE